MRALQDSIDKEKGKERIMCCKFIHGAALAANILTILALLFFAVTEARGAQDFVILVPFLIAPVLSVIALFQIPGTEERKLAKQVRLARLKKELEDLKA